jgi:aspartyl aminopeptidase
MQCYDIPCVAQSNSGLVHRLVHIESPILRIPNICIHLARADVHNAFAPNKETHT